MTDDPHDTQPILPAEEIQRAYQQALQYGKDLAQVVVAERERRRELEAALHLLNTVFASTPDGLIVVSEELIVQQVNPAFCDLVECSFASVEGLDLHETPLLEELAPVLIDWPSDRASTTVEIIRQEPDFQALQANIARLSGSGVNGWIIALHDHTQRTLAERALQAAHDQLEQRVEERTAELQAANQRLTQEIEERRQAEAAEREQRALAEALRDTTEVLVSTLDIGEVSDRILSQVKAVVPYDAANIMHVDNEGVARVVRSRGYADVGSAQHVLRSTFPVTETQHLQRMARTGDAVIIQDTQQDANWFQHQYADWARAYLGVPIHLEHRVIGFINLHSAANGFFNIEHGERLRGLANQAAIALKNARLYAQAQEVAALEERHRLARDLHDAVSQTLWSASILADTIPGLWDVDMDEGREALNELGGLIRGALAEMRTLLLELRPEALVEKQLPALIRQLAGSFINRTGLDVTLTLPESGCDLPPDAHVAIYRITQEALNNIMRHAGATAVNIHLTCRPSRVTLHVVDDGRGFDPGQIPSGHFGLNIMQERAEEIGATFNIQTEPGAGTHIQVTWRPTQKI